MSKSSMLRVVHVAEEVSEIAGGIPAVVYQLSKRLAERGITTQVAYAKGTPDFLPAGMDSFAFPPAVLGRSWSWSYRLQTDVVKLTTRQNHDWPVFHIHGIWSAPQYFASRAANLSGVPFVITAHGMLEPWLWNKQGFIIHVKKLLYWKLFGYPALSKASVIHAITPMERTHLSNLFPKNRIVIIPNAIDLAEYQDIDTSNEKQKVILFLGRIEPKKGVDILLKSFARANLDKNWKMIIVGPFWSNAYQLQLEKIVTEFNLGNRVKFMGPVFGEEKLRLLRSSWVMVVPSHSEVVGLVNLEAAAMLLPSITTHQTGLYDWEAGGGLLIQPDVVDLQKALERVCLWSDREREERGFASRKLIQSRYSWEAVLPMWISLYQSLI